MKRVRERERERERERFELFISFEFSPVYTCTLALSSTVTLYQPVHDHQASLHFEAKLQVICRTISQKKTENY